jgi:hypothetical protein
VEHIRQTDVIDEPAVAGDQFGVFKPLERLTQVTRHRPPAD